MSFQCASRFKSGTNTALELLHNYIPTVSEFEQAFYMSVLPCRIAIRIQFNVNITAGILRSKFSDEKIHFLNFPLHPYLVYADKEERIKGGGCLELRKFVEKELGLDPDSITGD